jgi:large subunit ribosomal protein L17
MRKKVFGRQLSRSRRARTALFRSLIRALILYGSIETTKAKAKAIQGSIDKLITTAKKDNLSSRRQVIATMGNDIETVKILFGRYIPAMSNRSSGYTRIIHLPKRLGDQAEKVRLEFVDKATDVARTEDKSDKPQVKS